MARLLEEDLKDLKEDRSSPASYAFSITPHDTNLIEKITKAIHVGVGGTVVLYLKNNDSSISMILDKGYHPLRVVRVLSAGTTATDITGLV